MRESQVAGHGHRGPWGWNTPERAHMHTTSFYLFLTCWQCSYYFFLKWDFTCQNISFFWAHPQQVLVLVFTSLLSSPDVYYWEYLVMQYIRALSFQVGSIGYAYSGYVLLSTYNKFSYLLHSGPKSIFFVTLFSENAVNWLPGSICNKSSDQINYISWLISTFNLTLYVKTIGITKCFQCQW